MADKKAYRVLIGYDGGFVLTDEQERQLVREFPECLFSFGKPETHTAKDYANADIMIGHFYPEQMRQAKNVRWLQAGTSGTDRYKGLVDTAKVVVTNSQGLFNKCMAEHTFALMIAYSRCIGIYRDVQKERVFKKYPVPFDLFESTVGIVGLGGIGSEFAIRAKAFGMRVLASKRTRIDKPEYIDALYLQDNLDALLTQSDFLILSLPLNDATKHLIGAAEFAAMKNNACLINVARGPVVDTNALIDALRTNEIGGACLDTTDPEPLEPDNPLWTMPNVLITPHAANLSPSTNRFRYECYRKNLRCFIDKKPMINVVKNL